ncbi:putative acyl-CoA transferase/carnitine dehydratase [Acidovorax sp. CF316]|uniref:CoA transferase n=1 Tax=Acidovorax sp. CF316 TaxID=1144317 RepID=UPI00026BD2A6|nr:CoA transferase [Acidovorax sp. CF316]EJE55035.1 putative acyl-CoA transferase/carnitine dehydratase [Acidovorax sp. CF316]
MPAPLISVPPGALALAGQAWTALGGPASALDHLSVAGRGDLPSVFPVTDLATASVGVAGLAVAELLAQAGGAWPAVQVDRRLASFWFGMSLRPQGWTLPPVWDAVAGDYRTADGWVRLHTNAPHHRDAALAVLGVAADREAVAHAVGRWKSDALEAAVVAQGGCAAAMRSIEDWGLHPQGRAVQAEPLVHWETADPVAQPTWPTKPARPLRGVRVLDLTRILAGPTATRFLAGHGADVLRIDPPGWDEPVTVPEVVLGKRCARLDLRVPADSAVLEGLLRQADVLVHGLRPGALEQLGLGAQRRRALNPGLVDVSLSAYGASGPWQGRRGFDSLVQMSTGIADAGMRWGGHDRPTPLPVQAIDHATGYLMAAAAVRGLVRRVATGAGSTARLSLARTARWLVSAERGAVEPLAPEQHEDVDDALEPTSWGPARRVRAPLQVQGAAMHWDRPALALGSAQARW